VEDIVDSGLTLTAIVEMLKLSGHPASVKVRERNSDLNSP